jgi:hypothetical protein
MKMNYYDKPFVPGKGYRGICKFCGEEFYGRLNKMYHYQCKVAFNNQKASKVNRSIDPLKRVIIKNDRILRSHFYDSLEQDGVEMNLLIKQGFQSKVFTGSFVFEGETYYRINKYAYTINENSRKIMIISLHALKIKSKK